MTTKNSDRSFYRHNQAMKTDAVGSVGVCSPSQEKWLRYRQSQKYKLGVQKLYRQLYGRFELEDRNEFNKRKADGKIFTNAIHAIPPESMQDFRANPRSWLRSRFKHSPYVFGALWKRVERDYFANLRAASDFLGVAYVPARAEIYSEVHKDETVSPKRRKEIEEFIRQHIKELV